MEIDEIKEIIEKSKLVVFNDNEIEIINKESFTGLPHIILNLEENKIIFTTDTPNYIYKDLENTLEILFNKFGVDNFEIIIHHHEGKFHDKNIILKLRNKSPNEIAKIIKFIQDNFYKVKKWFFDAIPKTK